MQRPISVVAEDVAWASWAVALSDRSPFPLLAFAWRRRSCLSLRFACNYALAAAATRRQVCRIRSLPLRDPRRCSCQFRRPDALHGCDDVYGRVNLLSTLCNRLNGLTGQGCPIAKTPYCSADKRMVSPECGSGRA